MTNGLDFLVSRILNLKHGNARSENFKIRQVMASHTGSLSMRKSDEALFAISILIVAALVVAMDIVITPILSSQYGSASLSIVFFWDFNVVLVAGLAGMLFAPRVGCPLWWRHNDSSPDSRRTNYAILLLGLVLVVLNTISNIVNVEQAKQAAPWLVLLTPETAVALSFRAALNEGILFRLFLFPLVAWVAKRFGGSQRASLGLGALASSLVYGYIHGLGFIWAFSVGLALIYIYHHRGLLPAMVIHFFADAIPLVLMSMML